MKELERLGQWCARHEHLVWDGAAQARFGGYVQLLEQFNKKMNLIGPLSRAQVVDELLLDSVCVLGEMEDLSYGAHLLDVGSGAGLPGVPLKLLRPDLKLTCVEPRKKRAAFLRLAAHRLGLKDVVVEEARIEEAQVGPEVDVAISKAFQPPVQWIETASELVAPKVGRVVCLTRRGELSGCVEVAKDLGFELVGEVESAAKETRHGVEDRVVLVFGRVIGGGG